MKKGAAHIEVILSFVLFVSFVLFLLFYIRPFNSSGGQGDTFIAGIKDGFEKITYTNVTSIFLDARADGCFSIPISAEGSSRAFLLSGESVGSYYYGSFLNIDSTSGLFRILISPDIEPEATLSCLSLVQENYTLGSVDREVVVSAKKLEALKADYNLDYATLKKQIGLPTSVDFAISSDVLELSRQIPQNSEVFAKSFDYRVLNATGGIETKTFIFKAW